jgi:DNA-binding response OmpR family regulator
MPQQGDSASRGQRPVVLVIENKPVDATLIRFMLSEARSPAYRFLWASSLQGARGLLKNRSVDVILASLDLPDGRGLEVIHALSDCADRLPVVALLTGRDEILGPGAVDAGAQDYLIKGRKVLLIVGDSGSGMSGETLARACEPFFTTRPMGRGLGLATAVGNAKAHKGSLHIDSRQGEGTTVTVTFPAASQEVREVETFYDGARENTGILVVDDEENVREVAEDVLRGNGHDVFLAGTGRDALRVLRNHTRRIGLVILDIMLPDQDGREVFHAIKSLCPDVRILLSSGKGADAVQSLRADPCFGGFLEKPFQLDAVLATVEAIVGPGSCQAKFVSQEEDPFLAGAMTDDDLFRNAWAAG